MDTSQKEDANEIRNHTCEFFIEEEGKCLGCEKQAFGISRCKYLCKTHYSFLRRDNKKRNLLNKSIPLDYSVIVHLAPVIKRLCKKEITKPIILELIEETTTDTKPLSYVENEQDFQF